MPLEGAVALALLNGLVLEEWVHTLEEWVHMGGLLQFLEPCSNHAQSMLIAGMAGPPPAAGGMAAA